MHQSESSFRIFLLIELLPVISTTLKLVSFGPQMGVISEFGAFLDPVADKVSAGA
jgi:hypothetical protein